MAEYLDFEIEIGKGIGREYPIAVIRSPGGEARGQMVFPFDELALGSRLKDLQIALLRSGGQRRLLLTPQEQTIQDFGQKLFSALMTGDVRSRFDVSQREAARLGKGLRIKLRIQSPELASLPWEFMFDTQAGEYICLSTQTPIVRYIEIAQSIQPLAIAPPLHVLGVTACPTGLPSLDIENEKRRVEAALHDLIETKQIEIIWLEHATWRTLQRAMRGGPWHILHFVGHGGFDRVSDEGILAFEDEDGGLNRLPATQLARLLADHTTLRLVILNSCEGAQGGNTDVFSSTASILVRHGLPAVLAMQYPITDRAAIEFSRGFYDAIADGWPVDAAVTEARKSISFGVTNTLEWGTPVLFMRTPDGVLFRPETTTKTAFDLQMEKQKREQARLESEALQTRLAAEKAEHDAAEQVARERAEQKAQRLAAEKTLLLQKKQKPRKIIFQFRIILVVIIGLFLMVIGGFLSRPLVLRPASPRPTPSAITNMLLPTSPPMPLPTYTPTPTPGLGSIKTNLTDGMLLLYIPEGQFIMGANAGDALSICQRTSSDCNPSYFKDQEPIHLVDMDAYWIDATEVTNAMYTECVHAGRCQPPFRSESATRSDYFNNPQYADYPVIYVSWNDANTYCSWVGGRLPTEAEWEEAARGTEGRTYPWGNATPSCSLANVRLNTGDYCVGDTSRVGAYPAGTSPYNALDMSGNLWEWVNDWYSPLYYGSSPSANPTGPSSGEERVLRGGSWLNREWQLGSAYRFSNKPDDRNKVNYGFRCAADP